MTRARGVALLGVSLASCCAPRVTTPPPPAACPSDTTTLSMGDHRVCVETLPVARGDYRTCVEAGACAPPPFSAHLAWGADHAGEPMPSAPEQARVYCAWAKRRLPTSPESTATVAAFGPAPSGSFRCVTEPGAAARSRAATRPESAEKMTHVNTQAGFASLASLKSALFAALVLDDTGEATCTRLHLEPTKAPGQHELVLFAHAGAAESRHRFELRGGTLRFTQEGRIEDRLAGSDEQSMIFVGGAPWFHGELECSAVPVMRPVVRPFATRTPTDAELADPAKRRQFLVHDDRVFFVREPDRPGNPGRCVRAGFDHDASRPRTSATLRVEARASERFYLVSEYTQQGKVFVSPADDRSWRSGLLPSGLFARKGDAAGWHLGDATLFLHEAQCTASAPPAPHAEPDRRFRHAIIADWTEFARTHREMFWVDPSGQGCERVELEAEPGFPLLSTWTWTPLGGTQGARYDVTVDADGVWLRTPTCVEHTELQGIATHRDGFQIGGSTVFESRAACEAQRKTTHPFVHHCPTLAALARPGPLPPDSLAAHGGASGFLRDGLGQCAPTTIELAPSWNVLTKAPSPPSLEGVWRREGKAFDVYEWPWTHTLFGGRSGAIERRPNGELAIQFEVVHPTLAACKKAKP
ncbi:MAG: hypothetical protein JNL79_33500 [Myxococcales bacterium]|nr:hypothetical protein [Myxococcales bacterium]